MLADIPRPNRAQQSVAQRVTHHIGVRVAGQSLVPRDMDAAQNEFAARLEAVNIGAVTHTKSHATAPTGCGPSGLQRAG